MKIYDSAFDLAEVYIENRFDELDHHIAAVLSYEELGDEIAESCDEYIKLSDGRIIEFEL